MATRIIVIEKLNGAQQLLTMKQFAEHCQFGKDFEKKAKAFCKKHQILNIDIYLTSGQHIDWLIKGEIID